MQRINSDRRQALQKLTALSLVPLLPASALAATASAIHALPRVALVIGNSRYANAPLRNPANDANAIATELNRLGFAVNLQLDAKRSAMEEGIRTFVGGVAKQKSVGLFYFAGHGLQLSWRNFLVPVDAALAHADDVPIQAIDLTTLLEGLNKAGNPMNIVILDACRDNPFGGELATGKGLSQMDAPLGTLLAYATAPGNVASDGAASNGLYTENLLREMRTPEARIEDVFKRVRLGVRRASNGRQIPWESTSLEEDFYFLPPASLKKLSQEELDRQFAEEAATWEKARQVAEEVASREKARKATEEAEKQEKIRKDTEKATNLDKARNADEEAAGWEKAQRTTELAIVEDYLRRYPSGRFAELAQLRLDRLLAKQGEEKIRIASVAPNPFSKGTAVFSLDYRVGDNFTYRKIDMLTGIQGKHPVETVTAINDNEVIYNNGRFITDLLGNWLRWWNGSLYRTPQVLVTDYSVGKKWTTRYSVEHSNGNKDTVEYELKVVARESVTVPAGTFDAFRIEGTGWGLITGTKLDRRYWIAPDRLPRFIAMETLFRKQSRITESNRFELVSYSQVR